MDVVMGKSASRKVIPVLSQEDSLKNLYGPKTFGLTRKRKQKKSFKVLTTEVIYQLAVVQQLRVRTKKAKIKKEANASCKAKSAECKEADIQARPSVITKQSSLGSESGLKFCSPRGHLGKVPRWWESLSRKSSLSRTSSTRSENGGMGGLCRRISSCSCSPNTDGLCLRHAVRKLWNKYFFAFPRVSAHGKIDSKNGAQLVMDKDLLSALMCDDVVLMQPDQVANGKMEVMCVFDNYEAMATGSPVKVEIIHLYVDEESSTTFSEYVLEFGSDRKHMRVCEIMHWDLDAYRMPDGTYNKTLIMRDQKPAVKRIEYFGKAMKIVPCDDSSPSKLERRPIHANAGTNCTFSKLVEKYLMAFKHSDDEIERMLCQSFRMNAFDGVKLKHDFISWLHSMNESDCYRKLDQLFVDKKGKTIALKLHVQVKEQRACVVHIIQWDIDVERIISIREYGESFRLFF